MGSRTFASSRTGLCPCHTLAPLPSAARTLCPQESTPPGACLRGTTQVRPLPQHEVLQAHQRVRGGQSRLPPRAGNVCRVRGPLPPALPRVPGQSAGASHLPVIVTRAAAKVEVQTSAGVPGLTSGCSESGRCGLLSSAAVPCRVPTRGFGCILEILK